MRAAHAAYTDIKTGIGSNERGDFSSNKMFMDPTFYVWEHGNSYRLKIINNNVNILL